MKVISFFKSVIKAQFQVICTEKQHGRLYQRCMLYHTTLETNISNLKHIMDRIFLAGMQYSVVLSHYILTPLIPLTV